MRTILLSLTIALFATTSLSGCLLLEKGECEGCTEPGKEASLKATYLSGNLGSYWDCPDQGYQKSADDAPASKQGAPGLVAGDAAPCEPTADEDSCGNFGPLNCEEAQITLRLNNAGMNGATGVKIKEIQLLDDNNRVRASFPILGTFRADDDTRFDGLLDPGATTNLRVDFQGPYDLSSLLYEDTGTDGANRFGYQEEARLRVIIESDTHRTIIIETRKLQTTPPVVT